MKKLLFFTFLLIICHELLAQNDSVTSPPKSPASWQGDFAIPLPIKLPDKLKKIKTENLSDSKKDGKSPLLGRFRGAWDLGGADYWKNRLPHPGYWQQDVHYEIKAAIDDKKDIIDATYYKLTYWNNSPHDLDELYFHLYQNTFQPGSYYHDLWLNNNRVPKFGVRYEEKGLGTVIENLKINETPVETELDNTILKVKLNQPLKSGDSLIVTMQFKTYFDQGSMRRRMRRYYFFGNKHYNGVHWYPAICVYDRKFGWTTDQHLDKEFYSDFGTFDVTLTFPHEYIVEATGVLQNRDEVLPDTLRELLNIENFKDKPLNSPPSIIIPKKNGKTKTWIYHAENVHNFAFTADPTYRIGEIEWKGIKIISLAQEPHASRWQRSAEYAAKVIRLYSQDFGMYAWPKIIVADAKDGMEYPMLTLDGGLYPRHKGLLAHEIAHMWFYGMVGNNETYRAFLDEGFAQFLTVWCMNKLERDTISTSPPSRKINHRYNRLYYPYLKNLHEGYDAKLNTHSAAYNGALRHGGGYGLVYYKAGVMLYNLQYVLGDELFLKAMQYYFNKWKFCHPYPEDFRKAIIEYTQTDLNWFFDQWLETTKYIDYAIQKVKKSGSGSSSKEKKEQSYEITFKRLGRMQMPLDFTVTTKKGIQYQYHIPNTWFVKEFPLKSSVFPPESAVKNVTVLPKWYGWDRLKPIYTAKITIEGKIKDVEIDPEHYLADIDLRNNKWHTPLPPFLGGNGISTWKFDNRKPAAPQWTTQQNYWRPDIWYNSYDGFQFGLHAEGNYFNQKSFYSANIWYNSRLVQGNIIENNLKKKNNPVSFNLSIKENLNKYWRNAWLTQYINHNAGLLNAGIGLEKTFRKQDQYNPESSKIYIKFKSMFRAKDTDTLYLLYPSYWSVNSLNNTLDMGFQRIYRYRKGRGVFNTGIRVPFIGSDFNYSYLQVSCVNYNYLGKFELKTRFFAQYGYGEPPRESSLYLAGANPETLNNNSFTRAAGFIPTQWVGYGADVNHFQHGGGLNLRGYAGYLSPDSTKDAIILNYVGKSGISANFELDFDRFIKFRPKKLRKYFHLDMYLFTDMGLLTYINSKGNEKSGSLRIDAGVGTALTIKAGKLRIRPLTIRFDMPIFLNRTPAESPEFIQFSRFVVGINRAF